MTSDMPTILNVDDTEAIRYAKTHSLRRAGYHVTEAVTGFEALESIRQSQPTLVLLDVNLPDINGFEVCRRIKQDYPDVLILQISASFVTGSDRVRGLEGGADSYLTQPVEPAELLASVKALLRIREAETALRLSEGQLQAIMASATEYAIMTLDEAGVIIGWSGGAAEIFGWREEEAIGLTLDRLYTDADVAAGVSTVELDTAQRENQVEASRWMKRRDGSLLWANGATMRLQGGKSGGFIKILRDRTEQRQAEEALQYSHGSLERRVDERTRELEQANALLKAEIEERERTEQKLRQSQKMETIGQLTGGVAHDFNNLLTIILGNLASLRRQVESGRSDTTAMFSAIENASRGADRAAALTHSLLAFARKQPLHPQPTRTNDIVEEISSLLGRTLGEHIKLNISLAADVQPINIDANQLEAALLNLAVNGRDAMPDSGTLTIKTENCSIPKPGDPALPAGDYVRICVSDTGIGMSQQIAERAFDPFFTTKDVGQGTGLGLSQVYGFVRQSGGYIRLQTKPGEGASVEIFLPPFQGEMPETAPVVKPPVDIARGSREEVVLVVEDEPDVRAYSTDLLKDLGYGVLEAENGAEALGVLETHPEVCLLFTDVGLPGGMNGRALSDLARLRYPNLRVLFTSGYAAETFVHDGKLDQGVDLLNKPFTSETLAKHIRDLLSRPANTPVPSQTEPRRVLLIEDEVMIRMLTSEMLSQLGYSVSEAGSAAEARALIAAASAPFSLIVTDIGLPDEKGDLLAREIRARYPEMPIILASGYNPHHLIETWGADPHLVVLEKPYDSQQVARSLRKVGVAA
ncbi:response regulator [Lacibacterium aquatile]|uniref:histidine kinase n=1 Tax=Lacibacterium aquatile TaxID=1168082 RepID=A0ABW5DLP0_9PROT